MEYSMSTKVAFVITSLIILILGFLNIEDLIIRGTLALIALIATTFLCLKLSEPKYRK